MNNIISQSYKRYSGENGGRVIILFLLFGTAIFSFISYGLPGMAAVCLLPLVFILSAATFKYRMFLFSVLMIINYFVMFANRYGWLFLPLSLHNEILELLLIAVAIIQIKNVKNTNFMTPMFLAIMLWVGFTTLEILNDSCGLGINILAWYTGARLMTFQILYAYIVIILYINTPQMLRKFLILFALLSLFAAFWAWKQRTIGFTSQEEAFLVYARRTHIVNGITRYFSVFSDASNFGINMAATSIIFFIMGITSKIKRHRYFLIFTGMCCFWAMFTSGTRTAIVCFMAGIAVYIFLSKSFKIAVPVTIIFALFVFFLAFTKIGQGNHMIRRMRSAFNKDDASMSTRDINKQALSKYMKDAPWGIGIGMESGDIPPYNKYKIVSQIPPDSEYVYIWVRTGAIGITVFVISTLIMFIGACYIVMFKIKNPSLRGIGAAFSCAFISMHLGGYANQILMQFPNVLLFYGGLTIVYILPRIENEYNEMEFKLLAEQKERERIKLEKKRAKRV